MILPKYPLSSSDQLMTFEFASEGKLGRVAKLVAYQPTNLKGVFNLAFGDKNADTGQINDRIITDNGDRDKVLATVASTVYAFTDKYPDSWVYLTGSTKSRTRLYRIGISKFLEELNQDFEIYGQLNDNWEKFKPDTEFEGFLVRRKQAN
ncbi:DUF6934 family protein [Algoriphagus aquatilis]|uniref:DUF6934 family protein n=1 Tax=Algoriphagus aquatilis TaxID=490186 RepID=A0ABW0BU65_9BACT